LAAYAYTCIAVPSLLKDLITSNIESQMQYFEYPDNNMISNGIFKLGRIWLFLIAMIQESIIRQLKA
jgi:hypothetical protein